MNPQPNIDEIVGVTEDSFCTVVYKNGQCRRGVLDGGACGMGRSVREEHGDMRVRVATK